MKEKNKKAIDEYQEWVEHQFNSGYWAGRHKRLGFPPKRGKWMWRSTRIDLYLTVSLNLIFLIASFLQDEGPFILLTFVSLPFSLISILRSRRFKPLDLPPSQEELDEKRHKEKEIAKRRKANRRKDYH